MSRTPTSPVCPACSTQVRRRLFCEGCWTDVPTAQRRAIEEKWKDLRKHPASDGARFAYQAAVDAAVRSVTT